jgi:hypothetical protein
MHVGQSMASALEFVSQTFVIDAQQMQHRGMKIMHVHGVLRDVVTEIVRLAEGKAGPNAAARHP